LDNEVFDIIDARCNHEVFMHVCMYVCMYVRRPVLLCSEAICRNI